MFHKDSNFFRISHNFNLPMYKMLKLGETQLRKYTKNQLLYMYLLYEDGFGKKNDSNSIMSASVAAKGPG